ncbi:HlyD family efflux transporter periplasmic adaptor subunit [Sphingobium sp. B2]|uniref:HlyD family efflux transporter periplasmic adaptor subunit n=1 Tax=Sphingobium sp. B2 TaxID=2583228 RepID=UPI00119FE2E9|nr:HlyD family efflux transporter periplasmic adaptor subunit [Sphingobium sp. B2]
MPSTSEPADDARLWASMASARDAGAFCRAWLDLQCARTPGAIAGLVVLEGEENSFAPAASWPAGPQDIPHLRKVAEQTLTSGQAVVENDPDHPAHTGIAYPIAAGGRTYGAIVLVIAGATAERLQPILRELHWGVGWILSIVWQHQANEQADRNAASIAALDVLAAVEEHESFDESAVSLCNALAVALECSRVSFGKVYKDKVTLAAMSHGAWFRKKSDTAEAIEAAMDEALDQGVTLSVPSSEGNRLITLQQVRLAANGGLMAVASVPVLDRGLPVGVITLERDAEGASFAPRDLLFAQSVASLTAQLLAFKLREERWFGGRARRHMMDGARALFGPRRPLAKALGVAALVLLLVLLVPLAQFRVSADAALEGRVQRAAAVPFSGFIAQSHARAGDVVKQGQLLATLDDRDLQIDHARSVSEVQQLDREYRKSLAKHERSNMNLDGAKLRQAEAQLRLIEYKLARTNILAPLSGVLVSGDVSQLVGTPVKEGEILFEVAPLDDFRVVLHVEEADITYLRPGQKGRFAPTGLAGGTVPFVVTRISSVTGTQDGKNTFRVEAELDSGAPRTLRPGMEGIAKVTIDRRSNLWIWTRGLRNWLQLFFWKWIP